MGFHHLSALVGTQSTYPKYVYLWWCRYVSQDQLLLFRFPGPTSVVSVPRTKVLLFRFPGPNFCCFGSQDQISVVSVPRTKFLWFRFSGLISVVLLPRTDFCCFGSQDFQILTILTLAWTFAPFGPNYFLTLACPFGPSAS